MSVSRREGLAAAGGFALLLVLFFAPTLFGGGLLYVGDFTGSDLLDLNIPRRALAAEAVRAGHLPLWTSRLGGGLPLLAEGQAGVLYPPNLLCFTSLSLPAATHLSLLITLEIALLGMYGLARRRGCRPAAAALASLGWALGGLFLFRLQHLNLVQVISWLPWSMLAVEGLLLEGGRRWLLAASGIWALPLLAGHPHAAWLVYLGTACHGALAWFTLPRARARPALRALAATLGAGCLALGLSATQWMSTWELVPLSLRGDALTWENATAYPFRPEDLARLFLPFRDGNPAEGTWPLDAIPDRGVFWENTPYMGLVPLLLALASPLVLRGAHPRALMGATVLWGLLALGRHGGLFALAWELLPGLQRFRFPSRFLILAVPLAALLAGLCLEALARRLSGRHAAALTGLLLLLTGIDLQVAHRRYVGVADREWFQPPASLDLLGPEVGRIATPTHEQTWQQVYQLGGGWREDTGLLRAHREVLAPDGCAIFGISHHSDRILREGGLALRRQARLQRAVREATLAADPAVLLTPVATRLLERQHVTHLLSFLPLEGPGLRRIGLRQADPRLPGPLHLYRTARPVPRFRLVTETIQARDPEEALAMLGDPALDPMQVVILEEAPPRAGQGVAASHAQSDRAGAGAPGTVELERLEERGDRIELTARSDRASHLVVLENHHPGWRATVDGQPTPLLHGDYAWMALPLAPGSHSVRLEFRPLGFRVGMAGSTLALLIWLGLCGQLLWEERRRARAGPDHPPQRESSD